MKLNGIVRIRKDLKVKEESFDVPGVTDGMVAFAGQLAQMIKVDVDGTFKLDVDNGDFCWNANMVEEVTDDELQYQELINNGTLCPDCGCLNETLVGKDKILKTPKGKPVRCPSCENKYLKKVLKDIVINLGCLEETGDPQVDSYTDYCLSIARKALKEREE